MDTFGARLRYEREDRGLTIQSVAETIGADEEQLRALEVNDFNGLPDDAVLAQWLHAYAECLDVDAELMIEDYLAEREKCLAQLADAIPDRSVEIAPAAAPSYGERSRSLPRLPVAIGVGVVVLAVGAWWMLSSDGATTGPSATSERALPEPAASPPRPTPERAATVPERPAPAPERPSTATATPASLRIDEFGVGSAVRKRNLVGEGDRFREGRQVWFWTRVEGGSRGDRIEHVWLKDGRETARIGLKIGGASWRTYSSKMLHAGSAGPWVVEARDEAGHVLARREFDCVR
jgi:transcriptional regulator with XRE-family HTH domain